MDKYQNYKNAEEIKSDVDKGIKVHWSNDSYVVTKNKYGYDIKFKPNNHTIGLTWLDGVTLNGYPEEFYSYKNK